VGQNRQLAAIMFTDIVGYTALMGRDEQQALTLLHDNREIHKNCIENHDGKLLKEMGDGILAQFNSALDAVQCAIEIQQHALGRVEGKLRIGIHLGDVIIEHNDVFGDGVNIASRLQAIADPGGIYISESVQKAIRSRKDIAVQYLCKVALKNVDYPLKTYALKGNGFPVTTVTKIEELSYKSSRRSKFLQLPYIILMASVIIIITIAGWWWLSTLKPNEIRIAVLPVENMTMVENGDFIVKGMHTAIIDEVNKVSSIMVTSKTSSAKYKDGNKTIPEIARELNVEMLVESELTQIGDSVQLRFRLIQAFPEEQIWSISYSKPTADILSIFGNVAMEISRVTNIDLSPEDILRFTQTREVNPQAYQAYLTGMGYLYELSRNGIDKALQYFNLSLAKDPDYAPAHLGVSFVWAARRQQGFVSMSEAMPKIENSLSTAISLDSTLVEVHYQLAINNTWILWKWEEAGKEFIRTLEIDPNHAEARAYYSHYLNIMHRYDESDEQIVKALELQPFSALIQSLYGMHLNHTRQYDKAIKLLRATLKEDPDNVTALSTLWTIYHNSEMYEEALETAKLWYSAKNENVIVDILINEYVEGNYDLAMKAVAEAYILKMDTTYVTPWQITTLYTRANMQNEALNWLEIAYKEHDANMPYINTDPIFDKIKDKPRFQSIINKMGLPQ